MSALSSVSADFYGPTLVLGVDRLAVTDLPTDYPSAQEVDALPTDWEQVAQEIHRVFAGLAARIRQRRPDVRSRRGKTAAKAFPLFAYYTFDVPTDPELDPVVVGVLFEPTGAGQKKITVRGDVAGEESGAVHYEAEATEVPDKRAAVLAAAYQAARELAAQADTVEKCLPGPGSPTAE